jgi:hypothetical protein
MKKCVFKIRKDMQLNLRRNKNMKMKLMDKIKELKSNTIDVKHIELTFSNLSGEITFSHGSYNLKTTMENFIKKTFEHAKALGLYFKKMVVDDDEIIKDEAYTFYLNHYKVKSNVCIGSKTGICTGSEYQWADGIIKDSYYEEYTELNTNFGIRKVKHYVVECEGHNYQYFPYSGNTQKREYKFETTCSLAPKIKYAKIFEKFNIDKKDKIKINIKRMDSVLSIEHQDLQKKNKNILRMDRANNFCIWDENNKILEIYITNNISKILEF